MVGEQGEPLPPGVPGQIMVRTPALFAGHLGLSAPTLASDGWWPMGDRGYLDTEGNLYVTGRLSNLLQRNGKKISPEAVEAVLQEMPGVAEAVVVGRRDPDIGDDRIYA